MSAPLRVGLFGFGLIGQPLATLLRDRGQPGLRLVAVAARDLAAAQAGLAALGIDVPALPMDEMVAGADVVAEAARAPALRALAERVLGANKTLVCVSAAGLLECQDLIERTRMPGNGRLIVASGCLPGLDVVRACAEAGMKALTLVSRVAPASLQNSDYVKAAGLDLSGTLPGPVTVYEGTAREAARRFPRHFNIGMMLQMAAGPDVDIGIRIIADPAVAEADDLIEIDGEAGRFRLSASHHMTAENRACRIVAPSMLAALRRLADPVWAGS